MSNNNNSNGGGIGFLGALGVLFIGLKLTGFVNWPWLWVTAPLWGGFAIIAAVFVIVVLVAFICALAGKPLKNKAVAY